jgi:hypothetical protein
VKQIRKTVTFITLICQDNDDPKKVEKVQGTGFFVTYPDQRINKNGGGFSYLMTNRHVAMCWDEDNRPMRVYSISIRVNLKDGNSAEIALARSGNVPWVLPADDSVDLALLPFGLNQAKVDFMSIPVSAFATDDIVASQGISEGFKIIMTGFFYQFPGERRMEPIIREGILAMMPDEDMKTTTGKPGKIYLGDVHVFGGNSGSPVFVDLAGLRGGAIYVGENYKMLGVVSGLYYENQEFDLEVATTVKGETRANSGIAMIVPASAVRGLLDDQRVQAMRDAYAAQFAQQASK